MPDDAAAASPLPPLRGHLGAALRDFYTHERVRTLLLPLLDRRASISLRTLDWVCTNYAKRHHIVCRGSEEGGGLFSIHHEYKVALSVFRRARFDPFRRGVRVVWHDDDGVRRESSIGQLNFIKWAHESGLLRFTRRSAPAIEAEMYTASAAHRRELRAKRHRGEVHKRAALSPPSVFQCHVYHAPSVVRFDDVGSSSGCTKSS